MLPYTATDLTRVLQRELGVTPSPPRPSVSLWQHVRRRVTAAGR